MYSRSCQPRMRRRSSRDGQTKVHLFLISNPRSGAVTQAPRPCPRRRGAPGRRLSPTPQGTEATEPEAIADARHVRCSPPSSSSSPSLPKLVDGKAEGDAHEVARSLCCDRDLPSARVRARRERLRRRAPRPGERRVSRLPGRAEEALSPGHGGRPIGM